jgi:uncharacterized protein (UPF0147 family)
MAFPGVGVAQSADEQAQINAARNAYVQQRNSSGVQASIVQMNQQAATSADCQQMAEAATNAAETYASQTVPPDPTEVIQNSTCYVDIAQIQIPVTGLWILDTIFSALTQFMRNASCNQTTNYWSRVVQDMTVGGGVGGGMLANPFAAAQGTGLAGGGVNMNPQTIGQVMNLISQAGANGNIPSNTANVINNQLRTLQQGSQAGTLTPAMTSSALNNIRQAAVSAGLSPAQAQRVTNQLQQSLASGTLSPDAVNRVIREIQGGGAGGAAGTQQTQTTAGGQSTAPAQSPSLFSTIQNMFGNATY